MKTCEKCGEKKVATGGTIVLADGYEIEEFTCKKCEMTMDKKQQLIHAITENPERRLIVMYSSEGNSDYAYSVGEIEKVEVTESTTYNDERVYFSDEYEELLETIEDDIYTERYDNKTINDEENAEIERLAKEEIKKYTWEPVIVVYVGS